MKNKIIRFLNTMAIFFSGMVFSSLLITKSESWHYNLPICLLCICLSNSLSDE